MILPRANPRATPVFRPSFLGEVRILRNEGEPQRPEIAVEGEDLLDTTLIGEDADRVIDERKNVLERDGLRVSASVFTFAGHT